MTVLDLNPIAFDTETTGLNPYSPEFKVFAYSVCDIKGRTDVARNNYDKLPFLWRDKSIVKVGHNILFDIQACLKSRVEIPYRSPIADTMVMSHILHTLW